MLLSLIGFAGKAFVASFLVSLACGAVRLLLARSSGDAEALSPEQLLRLRRGDVLLFGCRSILEQAWVQLPTVLARPLHDRLWVHAGVYAGDGIVWEAKGKGVSTASLEKRLAKQTPIRVLRHRYAGEGGLRSVVEYCAARGGNRYAHAAVFFLAFTNLLPLSFRWLTANERVDRRFRENERYSCAELVVEAFAAAGHPITPAAGWRVIAADLLDSPVLFDPLRVEAARRQAA